MPGCALTLDDVSHCVLQWATNHLARCGAKANPLPSYLALKTDVIRTFGADAFNAAKGPIQDLLKEGILCYAMLCAMLCAMLWLYASRRNSAGQIDTCIYACVCAVGTCLHINCHVPYPWTRASCRALRFAQNAALSSLARCIPLATLYLLARVSPTTVLNRLSCAVCMHVAVDASDAQQARDLQWKQRGAAFPCPCVPIATMYCGADMPLCHIPDVL